MTDYRDDSKNKDTGSPFSEFRQMFKERTGITMTEAFGKTDQSYKRCCPQPLYYQSPFWAKETWLNGICKEDFSSHYPSNAIGQLPDASTAITKSGRVKPDEEYRFAFYIKSGHVAEYGRFDSHDYMRETATFSAKVSDKKQYETDYSIKDEDEITVLMKASEYNLETEIRHFYDIKNKAVKDSPEYKSAKLFLLKFIGMMEQCNPVMYNSYPYAHMAAIIKWRANVKTFNTLKKIGYDKVIQICVDGFIHAGKPVGCHEKQLGNLVVEFDKAKFIQKGINQYILKQGDETEHKTAGFDVNTDSDDITEWLASPKVKFLTYIKSKYNIEEIK